MYINIVHRADAGDKLIEGLKFQQEAAQELGLKTTILASFESLTDPSMIALVKEENKKDTVEIGIHFHNMLCDDFRKIFQSEEHLFFLLPFETKKKVIAYFFNLFKEIFGFIPGVIGGYYFDAETLKFIKEHYPTVCTAITNCFEEGVHMYEGNNHTWPLFCEGGPWGAYYASRVNSLCPASCKEDEIGIVALPHLNRDMVMSLTSRDDYFSSHALNQARARVNTGSECTYMYRFIDKWVEQAEYNGYSYYNVFVSTPWVLEEGGISEFPDDCRNLYYNSLAYLKQKIEEGKAESMTMSEFGNWFRSNISYENPEINLWDDILCGSKRQTFWYVDSNMRTTIDMNTGGSICDIRPYAGRMGKSVGSHTKNLCDGSYPFIISTDMKGGPLIGSIHSCRLIHEDGFVPIQFFRTKGRVKRGEDGCWSLITDPVRVKAGNLTVWLVSVYIFKGNGKVLIERWIKDISELGAEITVCEYHRGAWGTTPYNMGMKGIKLYIENKKGDDRKEISYDYGSRKLRVLDPGYACAKIPEINTRVTLKPDIQADYCEIEEGCLSQPYYTIMLGKNIGKGEVFRSWIYLESYLI